MGKLEANATRAVVEQKGGNHDPPVEPGAEQRIDATERLTIELAQRLRASSAPIRR